jgi:GNAT superfamily N-acetyltransferase
MITSRKMSNVTVNDAFKLLSEFLRHDEHYLATSQAYGDKGDRALKAALNQFVERSELGFVWLGYEGTLPVAVCVVTFAISTSIGGLVAKLDDVFVARNKQGQSVGSTHLEQLKSELRRLKVRRIDTSVHEGNEQARMFYIKHGFVSLHEERMACRL